MPFLKSPRDRLNYAIAAPAQRQYDQGENPAIQSTISSKATPSMSAIVEGVVTHSVAGEYFVLIQNSAIIKSPLVCVCAGEINNSFFGATECFIPVENSRVLVYIPDLKINKGIILGVLPHRGNIPITAGRSSNSSFLFKDRLDLEGNTQARTALHFKTLNQEKNNLYSISAHSCRPEDLYPGDWANLNELGVGFYVSRFLASIKGSEKARVDVSILDDTVRIISGHYWHFTSSGIVNIYNDEGYLSEEKLQAIYQFENAGYKKYKEIYNTRGATGTDETKISAKIKNVTGKYRSYLITGYLGDIFHWFVFNPDPELDPEKSTDNAKHRGLAHFHVDSSGKTAITTASGFCIRRWDRIPVPKRLLSPWDPSGDRPSENSFSNKEPYQWPDDSAARALVFRDAFAWNLKLDYQRIHELSTAANKKDFYLPEENDLPVPEDEYDEFLKNKGNFSKNNLKDAVFNIDDNGSILIRDSAGSEIFLDGSGQIVITAPKGILLRSGQDVVVLSGNDTIIKSKNYSEIFSTHKDVRLKAGRNIAAISIGEQPDGAKGGGIFFEAKGDVVSAPPEKASGENIVYSGISFLAPKNQISLIGSRVYLSASSFVGIDGAGFNSSEDKVTGNFIFNVKNVFGISKATSLIAVANNQSISATFLTSTFACNLATSSFLIGQSGAGIIEGTKYHVPFQKVNLFQNVFDDLALKLNVFIKILKNDEILSPFTFKNRHKFKFAYRVNYRVVPKIYQPFWAYLKLNNGLQHVSGTVSTWEDSPLDENYAWPGKEFYLQKKYVKLKKEINISEISTGIPVPLDSRKNTMPEFHESTFNEVEILE